MMTTSNQLAQEPFGGSKDNILAVADMAIAFGQGSPLPWSPEAVAEGAKWVKDRLDKGKKDYWAVPGVRGDALALARRVGIKAADLAKGQMITETNVEEAIHRVLLEGPFASGCPFD